MKRLLALVATAGLAVGLYAATAGGSQQAVTPGQFAALKKQVTKLQKDVKTLTTVVTGCLLQQAVPVADFGGTETEGYQYKKSDGTVITTSALDVTGTGVTPQAWLLGTPTECANAINQGGSLRTLKVVTTGRSSDSLLRILRATSRHQR
jgi:hypothetical protein